MNDLLLQHYFNEYSVLTNSLISLADHRVDIITNKNCTTTNKDITMQDLKIVFQIL